jgi:hypothetical protein
MEALSTCHVLCSQPYCNSNIRRPNGQAVMAHQYNPRLLLLAGQLMWDGTSMVSEEVTVIDGQRTIGQEGIIPSISSCYG